MFEFFVMWILVPLFGILNGTVLTFETIGCAVVNKMFRSSIALVALGCNSWLMYNLGSGFDNVMVAWYLSCVCSVAVCLWFVHQYRMDVNSRDVAAEVCRPSDYSER